MVEQAIKSRIACCQGVTEWAVLIGHFCLIPVYLRSNHAQKLHSVKSYQWQHQQVSATRALEME